MSSIVNRFRAVVRGSLGLEFTDQQLVRVTGALLAGAEASGEELAQYVARLEKGPSGADLATLAQALTVPETYFFRNREQFEACRTVALGGLVGDARSDRTVRILSAGCATGEEAYSLAMVTREALGGTGWTASVWGVDVNPAVLLQARRGVFRAWSLRELDPERKDRWFQERGRDFLLDSSIREAVEFSEANLADPNAHCFGRVHDVIFCRNVLMYFDQDVMRRTVERLSASLAPGGYLFLGHAETLRGIDVDLELCQSHGTFYYRKRGGSRRREYESAVFERATPVPSPPESPAWFEEIGKASERIASLSLRRSSEPPLPVQAEELDLSVPLELVRQERFSEALDVVHGLLLQRPGEPVMLLLKAVILAQGGRFDEARSVCFDLLARDRLNAYATYVLGLCLEGANDAQAAIQHYRVAAYLEPAFAMPRVHLGILYKRTYQRAAARRELCLALTLLEREDPTKVLIFGGGFGRSALVELCRAELGAA